jgi:acetyl-CoA carboxylase/biotin carboxylase 1
VRITAENVKQVSSPPVAGASTQLSIHSQCFWGIYMDSSTYEFAICCSAICCQRSRPRTGNDANMVLALKEPMIRGDISTTVDYISKLIEFEDFVNNIHTGWLDNIIKEKSMKSTAESPLTSARLAQR